MPATILNSRNNGKHAGKILISQNLVSNKRKQVFENSFTYNCFKDNKTLSGWQQVREKVTLEKYAAFTRPSRTPAFCTNVSM